MNVNRVFITTSTEVRGVNTGRLHFPRYLHGQRNSFFGNDDPFDAGVWGQWAGGGSNWQYQGFIREGNGPLQEDPQVRGQIPFISRVEAGANGNANVTDFIGATLGGPRFNGPGSPMMTNMQSPLFAIVDHNSAHHMTLPLALKAFSSHFGGGGWNRTIVINLDAHEDYHGAQNWQTARCQNWGRLLIQQRNRPAWVRGHTVSAYAVFGLSSGIGGPNTVRAKSWTSQGGSQTSRHASLQPGGARLNGGVLHTMLGNLNNTVAYITIDRDFTAGSDTPYGDGDYQAAEGRQMMTDLFQYLGNQNVPIAGVDITGMPVERAHAGRNDQAVRNSLRQAADDIRHLYGLVSAY